MNELVIIKVGGALLQNDQDRSSLLRHFSELSGPRILVHGGGREASDMLSSLGIRPVFHEGRRVTDKATLEVVKMVYGGKINKTLVTELQSLGVNAIGMSGADANIITSKKRARGDVDFGFVGDPVNVDSEVLKGMLDLSLAPVICPLTHDGNGQMFNTNADTMASVVASALSKHYEVSLRFCFEFNGVLKDVNDPGSVIHDLDPKTIEQARLSGVISQGMLPKVENALKASRAGVSDVVICGIDNMNEPSRATRIHA